MNRAKAVIVGSENTDTAVHDPTGKQPVTPSGNAARWLKICIIDVGALKRTSTVQGHNMPLYHPDTACTQKEW